VFFDADCKAAIEKGLRRASDRFGDARYRSSYSSVTLPIELFRNKLPAALHDKIGLCRVFTIKARTRAPHEEIHRNSSQRLVSFRGAGTIHCARSGSVDRSYRPHPISSPEQTDAPDISASWDVVPENTWHYPQARGAGNGLVSRFTAPAQMRSLMNTCRANRLERYECMTVYHSGGCKPERQ